MIDSNDVTHEVMSDMAKSTDFHWVKTPHGNLVMFNPDHFFFDLWGQSEFDLVKQITVEQWKEFVKNNQYLHIDYTEPPPNLIDRFKDYLNDLGIEVDDEE